MTDKAAFPVPSGDRPPRRDCTCDIYTGSERLPTGEKVCERCGGLLS